MKRAQICVPDDLLLRLEGEARRQDVSVEELVRHILVGYFGLAG